MAKEILGNLMEQLSNFNSLDEKMQTIRSKTEGLSCRAADVSAELEDAESRLGKKRKREVEYWLMNVERKKNELQSLEQEVQQSRILSHSHLGKRADKVNGEVAELIEQGRFPEGLLLDVYETEVEPLVTTKLIGQAFKQNMEKIWECLMKDEVLRIGIYGMGGVGKTTLAMHINNQLLEKSKNFGYVYWVTVSQDFRIHKLQNDIAKSMHLDLSNEGDEKKRAAKLSQVLLRKKKCVLILDDVWTHFSLEEVGIPVRVNGCKLILTTRLLDVCHRMRCQKIIKVERLSETEAWDLFREKLGHEALPSGVKEIATSVAKRCAGLPLGIIAMAGSMSGVTDIHEWRNALEELNEFTVSQSNMEVEVFPILKYSYNRLRDSQMQLCFLYCALYPEDTMIKRDELIQYFIAEKLMDRRNSRRAKFDLGHTMLNKLEKACLLESCVNDEEKRCVKMHDLIRAMALEITSVSPRFMVKAGVQLCEMPEEHEWTEDLEKVSLMDNKIEEIPVGTSPRCPSLSTLILRGNLSYRSLRLIPDSFFMQMPALRVLDLSTTWIVELPNSISELKNLTALLLRECYKLKYVPPLAKALQVLDLSYTRIIEVPQGMEMLVNLKCLDMDTSCLEMLPSGILPRLSHLQHLSLGYGHYRCKHCLTVRGDELEELKQLEEFEGHLYNLNDLHRFVKFQRYEQLSIYRLRVGYVGGFGDHLEKYDKEVKVGNCSLKRGGGGEDGLLLPHDIQFLVIAECDDVSSCLWDVSPSLKYARGLKRFDISKCDGIECILSLPSPSNDVEVKEDTEDESRFQSLENLQLYHLQNLSALIKWGGGGGGVIAPPPPRGTLSSVKELNIKICHKIKKLFTPGLLQHLPNLEIIDVFGCNQMEEIIADDEEGMGASTSRCINLPKLRILYLNNLPELKSIRRGVMSCDSIEQITIYKSTKLKRLPFSLPLVNGQPSPPHALKAINIRKDEKGWWESLDWDHPNAKNVFQPLLYYVA